MMKKLNNKGYMIIEIIVASVIAFSVAYYLLNLTYKFKDKNEDVYYSTTMLADKINITKNIMNDLEGKNVEIQDKTDNSVTLKVGEYIKKIIIDETTKTITYGNFDKSNNKFDTSDTSYYIKKLENYLEIGNVTLEIKVDGVIIKIPISNIYTDNNYDIRLFIKTSIPTAAKDIINLYNDGSAIKTVNIGGDSSKPKVYLNSSKGIMLDDNEDYRYYGDDPNNYVTFNGETWRIIGVFNNVDDGTGKKETRLKIIRNESIGEYSYDSSASTVNSGYGVNDWSKADLNTELNSLYYNSTSGTCYNGSSNASTTCDFSSTGLGSEAKSMIDNAIYYLGGSSTWKGLYADDYYTFERGKTVYGCGTDDGACPRETTWTGKIGLMYPSDYVYATDLSVCTQDGYNYGSDTNCKSKDWLLYRSTQRTIAPSSSSATYAFIVFLTGRADIGYVPNDLVVRPVAYLKSNVTISGGSGTSSDPYTLALQQ